MTTRHLYSMDGVDTIAANSLAQSLTIWCTFTTELAEDYKDGLAQIPDEDEVSIRYDLQMIYDLRFQFPLKATFEVFNYFGSLAIYVNALAKEWAEVTPKPSIICSTEW